jgi:signal transduction histidine kinase
MRIRSTQQPRPGRRRSRAQVLIVLTAVLTILFGFTAWRTVTAERYNAESATCMFAADASRVLQARSRLFLESATDALFGPVIGRGPLLAGETLPSPAVLVRQSEILKRCHCAPELPAGLFFRFDVAGQTLTHLAVAPHGDSLAAVDSSSHNRPPDTLDLRHALSSVVPRLQRSGAFAAAVNDPKGGPYALRMIAVVIPKFDSGGQLRALYGLVVPPAAFVQAVIRPVFDDATLFSSILADTTPRHGWQCCSPAKYKNRDVANLEVDDYYWRPLYRTGPMPDTITGCLGMSAPEPALADLMLMLGPLPNTWASWVGKTLTLNKTPSLVVLLAAMLLCGAAAGVMAHRDAELANLRSDFVTSISHELRMPLAQILLAGETLSLGRTRTQSERDDAADAIVREAQRLSGLVDNVLFFSRIEHHNVETAAAPADLAEVVSDIVTSVAPLASGVGAFVSAAVPTDLVAMLDRSAFRQVLYNLLDNAFKYGPAGQHVFIGAAAQPGGSERIRIWVDDEGPGIPRGQETVIFEPFVRLEREPRTGMAGSGLGLAVVRHLVNSQGGRIWVERPPNGRGSRFVIELPRSQQVRVASTNGKQVRD